MSLVVWKEELKRVPGVQEISVPRGAEILCAREHVAGRLCIWFRCDPAAPLELRRIALIETGAAAPNAADGRYLGTFVIAGGKLVVHAFERAANGNGKR